MCVKKAKNAGNGRADSRSVLGKITTQSTNDTYDALTKIVQEAGGGSNRSESPVKLRVRSSPRFTRSAELSKGPSVPCDGRSQWIGVKKGTRGRSRKTN